MKNSFVLFITASIFFSCTKDGDLKPNIDVQGYWKVQDPTYASNSTRDLYHLFKGTNAFYRFSFMKTHDFSNLMSKPQSDSLISFYKTEGDMLLLPNPSASATNVVPGNNLIKQPKDELTFIRYVILSRDLTGKVSQSRTDTIRYTRVTETVKINYFDSYIRRFHP